jgi:alkylation response protein AidB-like acyl-CoA dehydrogenase
MHFLPTDEQLELQRGVREVLASAFPLDRLPGGWTPQLWQTLTETGVFSLPELGLGLAETALVVEELGRACVPGPLVGSILAGQAPGPVTVLEAGDHPRLVAHLGTSATVLVLDGADARLVDAREVTGDLVADPVDPLTPLTEVTTLPAGRPDGSAEQLRRGGAVLTAALQVGIAARVTELAVDYAKTREQFGRVIGSFQAVKHLCADMFVRTELARVAVHAAAVVIDGHGDGDADRAVAGAKLLADEAAVTNGRSAVQVHGGMGFTWEVPVHFFLKRAWLHATEFGTAEDHAEDLAALL